MIRFQLSSLRSVLCLGAHSDDLEIGAGATILRLVREHPGIEVTWVVFSAVSPRDAEARRGADLMLAGAGSRNVVLHQFPDSFFPQHWAEIKAAFKSLAGQTRPELVFTHSTADKHQDHSVVGELTWNTFRDHQILEYEIPKFEGDLGRPNFFVRAELSDMQRKIEIIKEAFVSQSNKDWFDETTFTSVMRIRGLECRSSSRFAEAFHANKMVL
jgi:LmbE family N-acetylglucosaminyl deacetylase